MKQRIRTIWKKNWERFLQVPLWAWGMGLALVFGAYGLYTLSETLRDAGFYLVAPHEPKIPFLDDAIPLFIPAVVPYLFAYYCWVKGYMVLSLTDRRNIINCLFAIVSGILLSFFIFVAFPTVIYREDAGLLAAVEGPGALKFTLRCVYRMDGGAVGPELFPSLHVLHPVYAYLCVRRRPEISKGYRVFTFVMIFVIAAAALLTKQHFVCDIFASAAIAVGTYALVMKIDPADRILKRRERGAKKERRK